MVDGLSARLQSRGWEIRVVSIRRLKDLNREIDHRYRQGMLDEDFYKEWISGFDSAPPKAMPQARSIILVAVPELPRRLVFSRDGQDHFVVIPPTYFETGTETRLWRLVSRLVRPAGYRVIRAAVPKKLLAVRSGLAEYGRNNVTYISGMGSFFGLVAFYSDLPAESEQWRETKMMERCESCFACRLRCPTGAIPTERFLLRAERCLTFHNERPAAVPFPAWIDPSWHNCLIGCLTCQLACPVNRGHLHRFGETTRFSGEQTRRLLQSAPAGRLPFELVRKLKRAGLEELLEVLPRNLSVMLEQRRTVS
jgi:epoxyqueuosine reductase